MANQSKLKTILEKINWLYKSFEGSNFQNISSLEKALLKEQVLIFYDEIESLKTTKQKEIISKTTLDEIDISKELKETNSETVENSYENILISKENENKDEKVATENPSELKTILDTKPIEVEDYKTEPKIETIIVNTPETKVIVPEEKPAKLETTKVEPVKENLSKEEKFKKTEAFQKQIAQPKRDMREIIDLNKSFIFKAELFNQRNDLYNQFINEMNTTQTEDDVFNVMIKWTEKQKWETEENKAYDLLLRAIEKRFLPLI